jgi:2-polyprenyl-6-methoxyphenol hydroxylase-like FAD-dependent oxidoreductase
MASTQVLIVGAGPTGLVLALSLAQQGIRFHCIDENVGPGEHSRAMGVQARTLEFYRQFGFADEMVQQGIKTAVAHLRDHGREILTVDLSDIGGGITPYPFLFIYPQDDHERFLIEKLKSPRRSG